MTVDERIERMLLRYLLAEKDIVASEAHFDETSYDAWNTGCDTCGYGGADMYFSIRYVPTGSTKWSSLDIDGDPLSFFPTLLEYDE